MSYFEPDEKNDVDASDSFFSVGSPVGRYQRSFLRGRSRPLFASQPKGGIPGADAVLEIVGNVYGQNVAPCAWYQTFDSEATSFGWEKSKLDPCLYFLRCPQAQKLTGVMGVHVDDTALGGLGPWFEQAVSKLREEMEGI